MSPKSVNAGAWIERERATRNEFDRVAMNRRNAAMEPVRPKR
jgi:hypothetical protein